MHEGARRFLTGLGLTVILGYPLLFYAHKFQVPWLGGGDDFRSYHVMVLNPLDFGAVRAPFAMRQLTAVIAHLILKAGFLFSNDIAFDHFTVFEGISYRADVFFSLILANFLGLASAGGFVYATVAQTAATQGRPASWAPAGVSLPGLSAVCLLLLAGPLMFHVVAPLTEGWSWFLVAAGVYFYRADGRSAYAALLIPPAAVFQRELVLPIFATLAGAELLLRRRDLAPPRRRFLAALLATSVAAMAAYFILRAVILPVPRTDLQQISPAQWPGILMARIASPAVMAKFARVLVKMNLMLLWGGVALLSLRRGLTGWERHFLGVIVALAMLIALVSIMVGADAAADRYLGLLTPLFIVSLFDLLAGKGQGTSIRSGTTPP
ncbi:hypothetical protein TSH100_08510 [Azospirillum sp. TSH100]|uniref:hypothetical protein n=1 Tax=Azospirillum sp. TSH100 TaxID=652764 RepID=UPI000D60D467|nr:hypothetical protein [Azospirillum sp. TSH100]PWC88107.1 hypothetical protein TSH100_08510 [Azospirillum sp. TSH100]QCG92142.1 hypothetical protein E6C72_30595 [Azospirillum sp. TSH100]